ncbi:CBM35 domain-containing protein [Streptomyces coacervatus]|uniref:CBM35 domain-containing protein n=1 Tax=Streptomyces coacervatus TaxID=647381 RepID=A0ABP7JHI4_9ACTN|nr:carbohydrate-binding protein [Streptomyces coacervatus]MDF2271138.1 carbohydrate-binding protein [Streptomyces coacervatus]
MTSGNNGASTPEDDDPFGYLYADGQANGAQPPSGGGGYGYPGSVNRVRAVGQRQYGQPPAQAQQTAAYGQVPQQQGAYGQPNAAYQAPETFPGGAPTTQQPMPTGGGRGRGPNTKGLLIGAVAVVAAVVIGIGVAMMNGNSDNKASGGSSSTPSTSQSSKPSQSASSSASAELPKSDAKDLQPGGGATTASDVKGAKAAGGVYVSGFNQVGATVTWTVNGIAKAGSYRLYVRYGIPGVDANATLVVNGKSNTQPLGMKNFGKLPEGQWDNDWQSTWANVNLVKGTNTIVIACNAGNQCNANLDQVWLQNG